MIDLTPLDVRKKRGDFRRSLRGYDPDEVDQFLELAAERMEELVLENGELGRKVDSLSERVEAREGREKAVQEALVTAQELRDEIRSQARQEADLIRREAEMEARSVCDEAREEADRIEDRTQRLLEDRRKELRELNRARDRFLRGLRGLLEREMDALEMEEERSPADDFPAEVLDSGERRRGDPESLEADAGSGGDAESTSDADPETDVDAVPFIYDDEDDVERDEEEEGRRA